ncbi:MAG: helix-turn-helix domain-containing protein, partial [Enterococcus sp.]
MDYELFEPAIKNKLSLLNIVYQAEDWVKIPTLCFKTDIGEKNVVKFMDEINEDLVQMTLLNEASGTIDYIKGKGFLFTGEELDYKKLSLYILKQSLIFNLLQELFLSSQVVTSDILNNYFVSESTLRRKVLQINEFLSIYHLSLKYSTKKLKIIGKETNIRYLGYQFFWTFYTGVTWPFLNVEQTKIDQYVRYALKNYDLAKKNTLSLEFSYMFALNVSRFHLKHPINDEDIPVYVKEINQRQLFPRSAFYTDFQKEFFLSDPEIEYIGLLFQCRAQFYIRRDNLQEVIQLHRQLETPIYHLYTLFTDETNIMYTPVRDELNLKLCHAIILSTFLHATFFKNFISVASGYDLSFFYQRKYPHLYNYMEDILKKMREQSDSPVLENAEFLLPRYCEAFSAINIFTKFEPEIVVKIDTNLT